RAALFDQLGGQTKGFRRALAHNNAVARADVGGEIQLIQRDLTHHDQASPAAANTACERFSKGPSTILPSKSMVPMPRAVASSYVATRRRAYSTSSGVGEKAALAKAT